MLKTLLKNMPPNIANTEIHFKKGDSLYTAKDKGKFIEPYSILGEVEIFTNFEQTAYIEALSNCTAIRIDRSGFLMWIKQDFEFSIFIMQHLSSKLIDLSQRTVDFVMMPVKERVLEVIVKHKQNDCLEQLTKTKLCYSVSAPLRSVNRAIKSLENEKIIIYKSKKFCLIRYI